jgi:hypothetical protein
MFQVRSILCLFVLAVSVLLVARAAPGDVASEEVMQALNAAKQQSTPGGMPDLDTAHEPAAKQKPKKAKSNKKKSNKKKSAKDWSKIDLNDIGDEWEEGDEEAELEHEYDRIQRVATEKASRASRVLKTGNSKKIKKYACVCLCVCVSVCVAAAAVLCLVCSVLHLLCILM